MPPLIIAIVGRETTNCVINFNIERETRKQRRNENSSQLGPVIVTKVNRASMPDVRLPEMSGMGEGFDGNGRRAQRTGVDHPRC